MNRYTERAFEKVVHLAIQNGRNRGLFVSFLLFSVFGTIVLVVWYGTGLMQAGHLSFGDLTAFVVYTAFVGGTLGGFADLYSQFQKTMGATQRVRGALLKGETESHSVQSRRPLAGPFVPAVRRKYLLTKLISSYPSRPRNSCIGQR